MSPNHTVAAAILIAFAVLATLTLMGVYVVLAMAWASGRKKRDDDGAAPLPSGWTLIARALARRCPVCGRGTMFSRWYQLNRSCPECHAEFFKNEGEWLAPMVIDYSLATAGALASWAALAFCGVRENLQLIVTLTVTAAIVAGFAPWSRSFWAAFLFITGEIDLERAP